MRTNLKTIKHVNDKFYKGVKRVLVYYTRYNGMVKMERHEIQNLDLMEGMHNGELFKNEESFKAWLEDYKTLINTYAPNAKLHIGECAPRVIIECASVTKWDQ